MTVDDVDDYVDSLFLREVKSFYKRRSDKKENYTNFLNSLTENCDNLRKIINWGLGENIRFDFNAKNVDSYCDGTVFINSRSKPFKQMCVVLHELGHHLVQTSIGYNRKYSKGYLQCDQFKKRNFEHRYLILEEEMTAWALGTDLAATILNWTPELESSYDKVKIEMIRGYVNWAATKR